jgi:hypothetical protein
MGQDDKTQSKVCEEFRKFQDKWFYLKNEIQGCDTWEIAVMFIAMCKIRKRGIKVWQT